ncbi:hypothetical protein Salat_1152900 [Sesamum alatum]|uniref:Reverse transcriptase zinc-binding domain-containing protein n=1 Tax=Sesamum alatum TaxID=300844 RepID=A0AAE1YEF8_9LAMI|nr:hypothetical protein Salat_1152900 [Sesamum alatum]
MTLGFKRALHCQKCLSTCFDEKPACPPSTSGFSSAPAALPPGWSFIWSRRIPNKVKVFGWKACRNALPTLENLACRRATITNVCATCQLPGEDLAHILLTFSFSRQVWAISNLPMSIISCWSLDAEHWFRQVCHGLSSSQGDLFLLMSWMLWKNRNKRLMGGMGKLALKVVNEVICQLQGYTKCIASLAPQQCPKIEHLS